MAEFNRVAIASRTFSLAAIFGLAVAFGNGTALQVVLVVAAIAAVAAYLTNVAPLPDHLVIAGEAGLASLIVVLALPDSVLLLPYLVVLPLIAALSRGIVGAALAICLQLSAMPALILAASGVSGLVERSELLAPWTLTIIGSGLLGAWIKKIGKAPAGSDRDESYESARRLLGQLRTLARKLSSGLDPVEVATELLTAVEAQTDSTSSALFVRTEGGVFTPLAYHGPHAREDIDPNAGLVEAAWTSKRLERAQEQSQRGPVHTLAFPLPLGSHLAGVVLTVGAGETPDSALGALRGRLDELSLRLETALAFDDVRTLVTADERQRLAREIHDGVAQEVASLGYVVDEIGAMTAEPDVQESLRELRGELSRIVTELRLSIFDLRSGVADGSGLGSAISDYVRTVGARTPITVHITLDEATTRLTPGVETELFRIAQEAITNARKHSEADNLWVDCRVRPPFARIEVRDDGKGLGRGRPDSYGLRIMRERAERIGASLDVASGEEPKDRPGTSVTVCLGETEQARHEKAGAAR